MLCYPLRKSIRYLLLPIMLCLQFNTLTACWGSRTIHELIWMNPVIVKGEIVEIKADESEQADSDLSVNDTLGLYLQKLPIIISQRDNAYIRVFKVLKNELENVIINEGDRLPLRMPSIKVTTTDIIYEIGTQGIWILNYSEGKYEATYPGDLQDSRIEDAILKIIKQQEADSMLILPDTVEGGNLKQKYRSSKAIKDVVNSNEVRYCYQKYKRFDPNLKGQIRVQFEISPAGNVTKVNFIKSDWSENPLKKDIERCITNAIKLWCFKPIPQYEGYVTSVFTFTFE